MYNVLLFEEDRAKVPSLVFLLKLAEINCTVAQTSDELLNWINVEQLMGPQFDLLLLTSLQGNARDNKLLTKLCEFNTGPIICVQSPDVSPSIFLIHSVVTCHPDDILDCIKELITSSNDQSQWRLHKEQAHKL